MELSIHTRGVFLSEQLRLLACQKFDLALNRLADRVKKVSLHLADSNGPNRGGVDKACRVVVELYRQESLVIEDRDASTGVVLSRIADRLSVAAGRKADRLGTHRSKVRGWESSQESNEA